MDRLGDQEGEKTTTEESFPCFLDVLGLTFCI